jgi:hypothetical protein
VPGSTVVSRRTLSTELSVRELTDMLLQDEDPVAHAQLVATPS